MCDRLMSPYRRLERLVTIQSAWHAWHHVPCLETRAANVVAWVCASCAPGVAGSASVGALPWRSGPESSRWCATIRTAAGLRRRTSTACRSRSSHTVHRRLDATYRSSATGIVVSATRLACWQAWRKVWHACTHLGEPDPTTVSTEAAHVTVSVGARPLAADELRVDGANEAQGVVGARVVQARDLVLEAAAPASQRAPLARIVGRDDARRSAAAHHLAVGARGARVQPRRLSRGQGQRPTIGKRWRARAMRGREHVRY